MATRALITIAARHQAHFERLKSHEVVKFDAFLREMDRKIRLALTKGTITDFTRSKLNNLLRQVDAIMTKSFNEYLGVFNKSLEDISLYEADFERRALQQLGIDGLVVDVPSDKQIMAAVNGIPLGDVAGLAGKTVQQAFDGFTRNEIAKMQGLIRVGYFQGQTNDQIVRRIRGTVQANYKDGSLAQVRNAAQTIVRTSLQHASNQARQALWDQNTDIVKRIKIVATLDSRTSSICRSLDGQEYPIDKGPRPPFHPRCRTTTSAVLEDKYSFLSKGRTRSARDPSTGDVGNVSSGTVYYAWLKKQPAAVIDSIIGPARGKLLRKGGLSPTAFAQLNLNNDFSPASLEQMRKIDPVAFTKAGL